MNDAAEQTREDCPVLVSTGRSVGMAEVTPEL